MRFFICVFLLCFLQCQERNDVEEYNRYVKESNLDLMQIDALKQIDYLAESTIEDAKNSRYKSIKVDIYAPIFYKLRLENNKLEDTINQLRYIIEKQARLNHNVLNEPKFFINELSKNDNESFYKEINYIIKQINLNYIKVLHSSKGQINENVLDRYSSELNKMENFCRIDINQISSTHKSATSLDLLKTIDKLNIINMTIYNSYAIYILNQLGTVGRLCYHTNQHLTVIKNLRAFPGSKNEIIVKTDIYDTKTEKLYINSELQKEFYDLDIYYYRFISPRKPGKYYHKIVFESLRADGGIDKYFKTLGYEVVDSCR